jgi:hypothetical protein
MLYYIRNNVNLNSLLFIIVDIYVEISHLINGFVINFCDLF